MMREHHSIKIVIRADIISTIQLSVNHIRKNIPINVFFIITNRRKKHIPIRIVPSKSDIVRIKALPIIFCRPNDSTIDHE